MTLPLPPFPHMKSSKFSLCCRRETARMLYEPRHGACGVSPDCGGRAWCHEGACACITDFGSTGPPACRGMSLVSGEIERKLTWCCGPVGQRHMSGWMRLSHNRGHCGDRA
jgi:hypothetical protein